MDLRWEGNSGDDVEDRWEKPEAGGNYVIVQLFRKDLNCPVSFCVTSVTEPT